MLSTHIIYDNDHNLMSLYVVQGSHSFTDKKIQDFSRIPKKNLPGPFQSP